MSAMNEVLQNKVVVINCSKDWKMLNELDGVVAVVAYDSRGEEDEACGLPVFHPDNLDEAFAYAEGCFGYVSGEEEVW
jgi:hypothetical protein